MSTPLSRYSRGARLSAMKDVASGKNTWVCDPSVQFCRDGAPESGAWSLTWQFQAMNVGLSSQTVGGYPCPQGPTS
jgi:hypothetical protein